MSSSKASSSKKKKDEGYSEEKQFLLRIPDKEAEILHRLLKECKKEQDEQKKQSTVSNPSGKSGKSKERKPKFQATELGIEISFFSPKDPAHSDVLPSREGEILFKNEAFSNINSQVPNPPKTTITTTTTTTNLQPNQQQDNQPINKVTNQVTHSLPFKIMDLPCITEVYKSIDEETFYKVGDCPQMFLVDPKTEYETLAMIKNNTNQPQSSTNPRNITTTTTTTTINASSSSANAQPIGFLNYGENRSLNQEPTTITTTIIGQPPIPAEGPQQTQQRVKKTEDDYKLVSGLAPSTRDILKHWLKKELHSSVEDIEFMTKEFELWQNFDPETTKLEFETETYEEEVDDDEGDVDGDGDHDMEVEDAVENVFEGTEDYIRSDDDDSEMDEDSNPPKDV